MMNLEDMVELFQRDVSFPTLLKQAAEECMELGHALLKLERVVVGENPTTVSMEEAVNNIRMEYNDVRLLCKVLELPEDEGLQTVKAKRWKARLDELKEVKAHEGATVDENN